MNQKRICCLVFARLASTRVPNKLLQKVGSHSLLERGLVYLMRLQRACPNVTPIVCCPAGDTEIIEGCRRGEIEQVDDPTTSAQSWPELIASHIEHLQSRFDWVWDANVFCHPFLRVETGLLIVERIERSAKPFTVTHDKRGVVWDESGEIVIGHDELANTKTNPVYHQLAHIAYCWPVKYLDWWELHLAGAVQPAPMSLHWFELIDIDTPEDLEHARAVACSIDPVFISREQVESAMAVEKAIFGGRK